MDISRISKLIAIKVIPRFVALLLKRVSRFWDERDDIRKSSFNKKITGREIGTCNRRKEQV